MSNVFVDERIRKRKREFYICSNSSLKCVDLRRTSQVCVQRCLILFLGDGIEVLSLESNIVNWNARKIHGDSYVNNTNTIRWRRW